MDTQELLSRVAENLSVRRSFGPAYEREGILVIPVALVAGGGGGGEGTMPPTLPPGSVQPTGTANGSTQASEEGLPAGSGGGFGGLVLPVGVYVVKGDQVRWVPAVDVTVLLLASLSMARLLARLWTRGSRRHHT